MISKTIKLELDRLQLPPAFVVAVLVFVIAGAISTVSHIRSEQVAAIQPTPALPIIILASPLPVVPPTAAPVAQVAAIGANVLPRAVTAWAAPDGAVLGAIEAGRPYRAVASFGAAWLQVEVEGSGVVWLRVAELYGGEVADLAPVPAPQVVYVSAPAYAAPTPAPQYMVTNDNPPADFYTTPPNVDPAAQQALIGSDPSALACGGSVFCGGLTNAQAQAALDQQRAGR